MTKPLGRAACDICGGEFDAYNVGLVISRCCGATHCPECAKKAEKRGDYSPDGDCIDGCMVDASYWLHVLSELRRSSGLRRQDGRARRNSRRSNEEFFAEA